jgi:Protein of unknown function (DUF4232)
MSLCIVRTRILARLLCAAILLTLITSACTSYQTIGAGPEGIKLPTKSSGAKTVPTLSKSKPGTAQQENVPGDTAVYCRLSDLTPTATWKLTDQGLAGSLTLSNYWDVACTLRGHPDLGLTDDNGPQYPLEVTAPTPTSNQPTWVLNPGAMGEILFTWQNWCGPKPTGSMKVTVTMAGQNQPLLYVIVQDENGNPLNNTPPCTDKNKISAFIEDSLRLLK